MYKVGMMTLSNSFTPDLVPAHCINNMECVTGETKSAQDYMLGKI